MLSQHRIEELAGLQEAMGYTFNDLKLLNKALTHKSYVNEKNGNLKHNERFEFLGDSVLDLIVSHYMVMEYSDYREGALSKIRAAVVNENCLAKLASKMNLGRFLLLGKGEDLSGGREKSSLLANAFEAVAGAIYFDRGLQEVSNTLLPALRFEIEDYIQTRRLRDHKSDLQEYTQNQMFCIPIYKVHKETGPDHDKRFEVVVMVKDHVVGQGTGRSKKEAEQAAAKEALQQFKS